MERKELWKFRKGGEGRREKQIRLDEEMKERNIKGG